MRADDASVLDAAALVLDYADDLVLGTVRDVHGAVAGRVHGVLDALAGGTTSVGRVHDAVAGLVYGSVGGALRASARGVRAAGRAGVAPRLGSSRAGRSTMAVVNGLVGERLHERADDLVFDIGVRLDGRDVALDPPGIARAFPDAGEDLVVFVHGLIEDDEHWRRPARPAREVEDRRSYGDRLAEEGWTPVHVRVNTGLPVAENGAALASVLDRLVAGWPVGVRRIALVGHSMGGLVVRAACAVSTDADRPWTEYVTDVVCLGTPHLGAPLEQVVACGVSVLEMVPESAPFGRILEYRSTGILDLRHGLASDVENLPHARYRLVAATLSRSPTSIAAATVGDLLVPYGSAVGRRRGGEEMFPGAQTLHVPGAGHLDLLNHDEVYAAIRDWLRDRTDPPTRWESPPRRPPA